MKTSKEKPYELHVGDARNIPLPDDSVQCIVTSPPYWGLRKYAGEQELVWSNGAQSVGIVRCNNGDHLWNDETLEIQESVGNWQQAENGTGLRSGVPQTRFRGDLRKANEKRPASIIRSTCTLCGAWRGAFGLEPTIEMYVAHTLEILRESRRVLRPDGVLFWNLGDSYSALKGYSGDLKPSDLQSSNRGSLRGKDSFLPQRNPQANLKPKDLCLIPHRVALAAQADGWWVRSMIVWTKPNPMPESVTDRPTDAYEHIIMLTKSERYFWDADAVRETTTGGTHSRGNGDGGPKAQARGSYENWTDGTRAVLTTRNMRNVWTFATQPYPEAHFATLPEELPRRCIRAATSERGACAQCGAPWQRVTQRHVHFEGGSGAAAEKRIPSGWHQSGSGRWRPEHVEQFRHDGEKNKDMPEAQSGNYDIRMGPVVDSQTIGWTPTCTCPGQRGRTVPCVVLDPFTGSGTTGKVAMELGRRFVGMDLAYHELSRERIESGIPGTAAWIREKNNVRVNPAAELPLFANRED